MAANNQPANPDEIRLFRIDRYAFMKTRFSCCLGFTVTLVLITPWIDLHEVNSKKLQQQQQQKERKIRRDVFMIIYE